MSVLARLMISGPGIEAGRTFDCPVHTEDFFPSLLGLCGLSQRVELSGIDFSPLVYGATENLQRDGVFLEYIREERHAFKGFYPPWRGYVDTRYKYAVLVTENGDEQPWMLFDLANDPYEQNNMCQNPRYADLCGELHAKMVQHMA